MYQVLEELNKTSGISGSMVVGDDGIVIAADMDASFEEETVGALAASITSNIKKSMSRLEQAPLTQVTIEATSGKLFFDSCILYTPLLLKAFLELIYISSLTLTFCHSKVMLIYIAINNCI